MSNVEANLIAASVALFCALRVGVVGLLNAENKMHARNKNVAKTYSMVHFV